MATYLRCNRCFAPMDAKDDICEFCGLNRTIEQNRKTVIATKKRIREKFKQKGLPDGLSFDDKIHRIELIYKR